MTKWKIAKQNAGMRTALRTLACILIPMASDTIKQSIDSAMAMRMRVRKNMSNFYCWFRGMIRTPEGEKVRYISREWIVKNGGMVFSDLLA
jgi:hypothetical protein